jgi:hypothetical protein
MNNGLRKKLENKINSLSIYKTKDLTSLILEINRDYMRTMNKILFD